MKDQPSMASLLNHADSKYTVVLVAARRARQIMETKKPTAKGSSTKPVSVALAEMIAGKLSYVMGGKVPR